MHPSKTKILYIITKSNFGGAQHYVYDLAAHLPKNQFEPAVAFGGSGPLKEKLEEAGITAISIPGLERNVGIIKECKAFASILRIIRTVRPDIVHLNSSKAGLLGALAARLLNTLHFLLHFLRASRYALHATRIVFTAHGFPFKEKRRFIAKKLIEYGSWLTIALSNKTIVVSRDDREKIKPFLFVQSKIKLVHNGIEMPAFADRAEARRIISQKIGHTVGDNDVLIGTVAELHKNKGLEYAISAFAMLKHKWASNAGLRKMAYIIIGGGEERKTLESMIAREGLQNTIFLAGEYPEASSLLKAFDVFLLPSLKEGLPYVILEAGYTGLPIIATNVGGVNEVIEDMKSGIVIKEKRPKEIAEALEFLVEHKEKAKEFGDRLAKTIHSKFTLEQMIKETILLYTS